MKTITEEIYDKIKNQIHIQIMRKTKNTTSVKMNKQMRCGTDKAIYNKIIPMIRGPIYKEIS